MSEHNPSLVDLASHYKALGYEPFYAWDRYVADTGLKPMVDAKEFYRIYANVVAEIVGPRLPASWVPTHIDTMFNRQVQIKHENGVYYMIWDNGYSGSDPESLHPYDRYVELTNDQSA